MPKNIVVYSDGTGQDGGVRPEQRISNIYKMYRVTRAHPDNAIDPAQQVAFYDAGLGTDIGSSGLTAPVRSIQKLLGSVMGQGIKRNIADCYEFIINHYEEGDRIFLFGFSRGAYTARSVANLLMLCGVPTKTPTEPVMKFRKAAHDIAWEAVDTVLEHGAGHPRAEFEDERLELARRFQDKYGSGDGSDSNAAPYFIGVYDTVAALGASGTRRFLINAGLTAGVATGFLVATLLPALALSEIIDLALGSYFWTTFWLLLGITSIGGTAWWWKKQKAGNVKTIRDFPKMGDVHSHVAEWKGDNFDRLLSKRVKFARSANAIDELRKDFDRVAWGGVQEGAVEIPGHTRLIQLWFAGNHSDIGGSYPEPESRLSDIALEWMCEQATKAPDGLKAGPIFVDGVKMADTGDVGFPLHIYPAANGIQHCEIAGMRDTLDGYAAKLPKWNWLQKQVAARNWEIKVRSIKPNAPMHPTVAERFSLPTAPQCSGEGMYRPEALKEHEKFHHFYPA